MHADGALSRARHGTGLLVDIAAIHSGVAVELGRRDDGGSCAQIAPHENCAAPIGAVALEGAFPDSRRAIVCDDDCSTAIVWLTDTGRRAVL